MPFLQPTAEELAAVEQLKTALQANADVVISPRMTDVCLLRFLRGCKGNFSDAYNKLVKHAQWRLETKADDIDELMPRYQAQLDKKLSVLDGVDKEGRPLLFCFVHRHVSSDRNLEEMILFIIYSLETLVKRSKPEEEMFTIVFDLGRFSMRCMDFEVVKHLLNILQTNYPDTLEKLYIVDSPMIFSACWAVIKPWIDPVTANKVSFIKKAQLTQYIDEENIVTADD